MPVHTCEGYPRVSPAWRDLMEPVCCFPSLAHLGSHPVSSSSASVTGSDYSLRPVADSLHHCRPCQPQLLRPLAGPVVQHVWLNAASSVLHLRADYCLTPLSRQRPAGTTPVRSHSARGRRRLTPDIIKSFATTGIQMNLHDNREGLQIGGSLPGCMKSSFYFHDHPSSNSRGRRTPPSWYSFLIHFLLYLLPTVFQAVLSLTRT